MRRLAAALIVAVALWPAVIASTATADIPPGNPATPTPTIEPFPTGTPTPSPEPAPSPTPIPLTVTGANGVVFLGGVYQTGSDHYTITAKAPTDLPGTWDLIDNYYGASDLGGGHADHGIDGFSWDWSPGEGAHELVATFHPDCATGQSCAPDFSVTGSYGVMEAYPTPTPTPPPTSSSGPTPTPSPIPINVGVTANPASPQPAATTVRITVGSNYNDPGAWSISVDGTFLAGQLSNSYGGGPRGSTNWVATPGTHQITGTISPTACPYGPIELCPRQTSATITYVVTEPTPTSSPSPEPTLAVPLPTPPAGLTGPGLVLWQKLIAWLLGQLKGLTF